ncbi:MAG: SCP2 sterol-binding domain-containing protein [Eubacteriales bacterium]|nr:SCP2 sterol-binding domain-containing protein [Eubacteriales bacterium]
MADTFRQDIDAMYAQAARCDRLDALVPSLYAVLGRNGKALAGISYAYRLSATDTGYTCAFSLTDGRFAELTKGASVDVTVVGREANLLSVFQRRLNPVAALALRKIRVEGNLTALMKLAAFL